MGVPEPWKAIHVRVDASVLRWFNSHVRGYQTRINAMLRAFAPVWSDSAPLWQATHGRMPITPAYV